MTKPTSHQPVRVSFSTRPINVSTEARPPKPADETPLKSAVLHQPRIFFSSKGLDPLESPTSQALLPISNMQSTTQSSLACGPSYFASPPFPEVRSLRSLRRDRPVPPVVIQKFDGDPINYWLFVRQFEAHVLGKVDDYELFPLLYQNCEPNVQHKFNHLSNQLPSASFEAAWNILFDEYGHPHEIACCCEERLKSAPRVAEDDRERLKSLAQLLEKCCVSLEHIGEASTLDSMRVMMNIINKLPVELKRAWIEYAVKIERQAGHRAKFANLSAFLTERSRLANSIFGRETFPGRSSKPRRESTYVVSEKNPVSKDLVGSVKCHFCNGDHKISGCKEFSDRTFDERYDFVRLRRLCFKCLSGVHIARECKSKVKCTVAGCSGTLHHTLLHKPPRQDDRRDTPSSSKSCKSVQAASVQCQERFSSSAFLNVVPVRVKYLDNFKEIYAFLDQGSTTCFCDQNLAKDLEASGLKRQFALQTLTATQSLVMESLKLSVQNLNGGDWIELPNVAIVKEISVKPNAIPDATLIKQYSYLRDLEFPSIPVDSVQLLIGANVPQVFGVDTIRQAVENGLPDAVCSPLGWSLLGPAFANCDFRSTNAYFVSTQPVTLKNVSLIESKPMDSNIEEVPEMDVELEDICCDKGLYVEDRRVYYLLKRSIKLVDGHYELPLPWRNEKEMPDNKIMAEIRLNHLKRKLQKNPELKQKYLDQMQFMLEKGYAERVVCEAETNHGKTWYIPHHAVINPHKPNKIRIVFDYAAEYKRVSLNKWLMQGPDSVNSLMSVLLRF